MADQQLWQCQLCGHSADGDVKPAVAFEDNPPDWSSPVCGAEKDDFLLQDNVEV
jgi:rubredoxin---NAD+ reductase